MSSNPCFLLLRSSLTCSLVIAPIVILAYFSYASVDFQNWVMEMGRLAIHTLMRSSELPMWLNFALVGLVYWAQCVISKLIKHKSCASIVLRLMWLQWVVLLSSLIMAPGVLSGLDDNQNFGFLYILHVVATLLFSGHNADRYIALKASAKED